MKPIKGLSIANTVSSFLLLLASFAFAILTYFRRTAKILSKIRTAMLYVTVALVFIVFIVGMIQLIFICKNKKDKLNLNRKLTVCFHSIFPSIILLFTGIMALLIEKLDIDFGDLSKAEIWGVTGIVILMLSIAYATFNTIATVKMFKIKRG